MSEHSDLAPPQDNASAHQSEVSQCGYMICSRNTHLAKAVNGNGNNDGTVDGSQIMTANTSAGSSRVVGPCLASSTWAARNPSKLVIPSHVHPHTCILTLS